MIFNKTTLTYLIDLLNMTGCEFAANFSQATICTNIVKITQANWLRPKGKERWHLSDTPLLISRRKKILSLLKKLGFIAAVKPRKKNYDAVFILGASDLNLLKRIHYLQTLCKKGVRFKKVFLLAGEIKLTHDISYFQLANQPKTSAQLILATYNHIFSREEKNLPVIPIFVKGKQPRANTEDTLRAWLKKRERVKDILVISNQPFVLYQDQVVKRVLANHYQTDTVGDKMDLSIPISVVLDSLARFLYERHRNSSKK